MRWYDRPFSLVTLVVALAVATTVGAQTPGLSVHADVGGAFAHGGGYANDGGLTGRLGLGFTIARRTTVDLEASGFVVLNGTLCADAGPPSCPPDFPSVRELVAELRFSPARPVALERLTLSVGAGAAHVSGGRIVSETKPVWLGGAEYAIVERSTLTVSVGARAEVIPSTRRGTLSLVPVTIGARVKVP